MTLRVGSLTKPAHNRSAVSNGLAACRFRSGTSMNTDIFRTGRVDVNRREAIRDAAATLQLARSKIAAGVLHGAAAAATIVGVGEEINSWMLASAPTWRENLSARPSANAAGLRVSIPTNRACVERGQRMISIFDERVSADVKLLLAGETQPSYLLSSVPVQMKIINREFVLLQGPPVSDTPSVMAVRDRGCLDLAMRYWSLMADAAYPWSPEIVGLAELTPRQRQIVALLSVDTGDEAIANCLGVSVRTVRSDIADVMDALGVRSRFAAGQRLTQQGAMET